MLYEELKVSPTKNTPKTKKNFYCNIIIVEGFRKRGIVIKNRNPSFQVTFKKANTEMGQWL